ncbi:MAG: hypothetical protein CBD88_07690 [Flavobacteriales bacterium TMED228]|nr:MAG: hypothetical protein CBD88_07690 [Flavobacteriales bacterium TMED228]|tara:strand:- start:1385 stop:1693 length:309 start_codon:yes stop_codon:yes gene_type:complete
MQNKYHPDPDYTPMIPRPEEEVADWFAMDSKNPLDDMPIATNDRFDLYGSSDAEDAYSSRHKSSPDFEKSAEEVVTMHEKMYRMATKNGGSWLGGSENVQSN